MFYYNGTHWNTIHPHMIQSKMKNFQINMYLLQLLKWFSFNKEYNMFLNKMFISADEQVQNKWNFCNKRTKRIPKAFIILET